MTRSDFIALAALAVSVIGTAVPIWYHCKRDNERFGRIMQKLGIKE